MRRSMWTQGPTAPGSEGSSRSSITVAARLGVTAVSSPLSRARIRAYHSGGYH